MRKIVVIALIVSVILVASITTALGYVYFRTNPSSPPRYDNEVKGYHIIAGNNSASDGRLIVRLNSYRIVYGGNILFQVATGVNGTPPSNTPVFAYGGAGQDDSGSVYVLTNVTFQNIGPGPAFIGTSYVEIANGATNYSNSEIFANASFPNEYPNASLPSFKDYAGANLPANSSSTYWLLFVMPQINNASGFTLKQYIFFENQYGGTYEGQSEYVCACVNPMVEFIILPESA